MALDVADDRECPHCPPAQIGPHDHHALPAHSSAVHEVPCATSAEDCSLSDELNYDGRNVQLKLKDLPGDIPLITPPLLESNPSTRPAACVGWYPTRSPPPGSQPPLNVLHCVYLD